MEALDQIGDFFTKITAGIEKGLRGIFGASNERQIKQLGFIREKDGSTTIVPGSFLDIVAKMEPETQALSDDELRQTATIMRTRLAAGETLDDIMPAMFARIREAGVRVLGMRHYDVQLVGGAILHGGNIAEMTTGEGKTLMATLPTALNAVGGHVHVVTVNDYLALRDMEWMAPLYMSLGLTVGAIQANMTPMERQAEYAKDITYGTNNEFGFDYLRDNMKSDRRMQVQGPLDFAIVDEIDNILIDEARTPLIIAGAADDDTSRYPKADAIARKLKPGIHFEVKEKERTAHLTDEGVREAERLAGVESFYTAGNMEWPHLIDNALKAHHLFALDKEYIVGRDPDKPQDGIQVVIVDEHTGRKMYGRQWSDGLHQAVSAKEGVPIRKQNQTLATITLQNYFKLYTKLAGMTGTAMTEADEFYKIYGLDVIAVPTNRAMQRIEYADQIYRNDEDKYKAVIDEIKEVHQTGRPVLVGTTSVEKSELVSRLLNKNGIKHNVLNAKFHEREAEIVAQAGRKGAVTVATNMAGRGTDIVLGGNPDEMAWDELHHQHGYQSRLDVPKQVWESTADAIAEREGMKQEGREVAELGGLHVIGTERHDARRIDLQLRGRSGRQGDPGSSRFFLSLDDSLMRIFGGGFFKNFLQNKTMREGEVIDLPIMSRQIAKAQKGLEERHFESRKNLLEYDEVMDFQRKEVYSFRQRILDGANCREIIFDFVNRQVQKACRTYLDGDYRWDTIVAWAGTQLNLDVEAADIRDMDPAQLDQFLRDEAKLEGRKFAAEQVEVDLPYEAEDDEWNWQALQNWANSQYGLSTSVKELKAVGRDEVTDHLIGLIEKAVDRADLTGLRPVLEPDFAEKQLCYWVQQQYGIYLEPGDLPQVDLPEETAAWLVDKVREAYREQEVQFPVSVAMTKYLPESGGDRTRLADWFSRRFGGDMPDDFFESKSRRQIHEELINRSREFYPGDEPINRIEKYLDQAYESDPREGDRLVDRSAVSELVRYANDELRASVDEDEVIEADKQTVKNRMLDAFDQRYRVELGKAERDMMLHVLDDSWKDHLLFMDQLKASIGLVGYEQKDPKTEFKRQGMAAFEEMWDRIGDQVITMIFRVDRQPPEYVGSLWNDQHEMHPSPGSGASATDDQPSGYSESSSGSAGSESGGGTAVETIVNTDTKVGRNDPCPCGSGRKFKKCCG